MDESIEFGLDLKKASKKDLENVLKVYQAGYIMVFARVHGIAAKAVKEAEVNGLIVQGMFHKWYYDEQIKLQEYVYDRITDTLKDILNEFKENELGKILPATITALARIYAETVDFAEERFNEEYIEIIKLFMGDKASKR